MRVSSHLCTLVCPLWTWAGSPWHAWSTQSRTSSPGDACCCPAVCSPATPRAAESPAGNSPAHAAGAVLVPVRDCPTRAVLTGIQAGSVLRLMQGQAQRQCSTRAGCRCRQQADVVQLGPGRRKLSPGSRSAHQLHLQQTRGRSARFFRESMHQGAQLPARTHRCRIAALSCSLHLWTPHQDDGSSPVRR